jgi:ribosomal protein S18 acetylase RimI-like enzyme
MNPGAEGFVLHQVDASSVAVARELFHEYAQAIGTDLEYQGFSGELASLPSPYAPPAGVLLIAQHGSQVAGCVALRPLDAHTGEMKRLYVRSAFRGAGLGKILVEAAVRAAREARYRDLRLDTLPTMTAALSLYRQLGFAEIPPYGEKYLPGTRFYSLALVP